MSSKGQSSSKQIVYQEFGSLSNSEMLKGDFQDLLPQRQNIRVEASRAGRRGKTVTLLTGFQDSTEELAKLLKQFKSQCGSGGTIKNSTIEIQGNHCQLLAMTLSKLGYKVKIISGG